MSVPAHAIAPSKKPAQRQVTLTEALGLIARAPAGERRLRLKRQVSRSLPQDQLPNLCSELHRRGLQALNAGSHGHAMFLLGWLTELAPRSFDAMLAKAAAVERVAGAAAANEAFDRFVSEQPAPRIGAAAERGAPRVGILVSRGNELLSFEHGGFTLPQGHAQAQHLAASPEWDVHFAFAEHAEVGELEGFDLLINAVSDPDAFGVALRLIAHMDAARVLNPAQKCLRNTREFLSEALSGREDFVVPRTIRVPAGLDLAGEAERSALRYPLLARPTGSQTGAGLTLAGSADDLHETANAASDWYLTEFFDFASEDGFYRKYRCWQLGDHVHPSHLFIHDHWNVHGHCRWETMLPNAWMQEEEQAFLKGNWGERGTQIRSAMAVLRETLQLDFFGVDFGFLPDGRLIVFEANATMRSKYPEYGSDFEYIEETTRRHVEAFQSLIRMRLSGSEK